MDWLRTSIELTDPRVAREAIGNAETIRRLDFEYIPRCEFPACEDPAVWVGASRCCDVTRFGCEPHRRQTDVVIARDHESCRYCAVTPHPGIRWVPSS